MKVLTWNLEWAHPGSKREEVIRKVLAAADADIICLTEAFPATLPTQGHVIQGGLGNPVADRKGAKKVLLWSCNPWLNASTEEAFSPPGRIVSGTTETELGRLQVFGVCIPWASSNTPRFGGERRLWEDHLGFLDSLQGRLRNLTASTIVLGDFNQRLPRRRQPSSVADKLEQALASTIVATTNFRSQNGQDTIDHIAHTADLLVSKLCELPRNGNGLRLSDHFGVMASIRAA